SYTARTGYRSLQQVCVTVTPEDYLEGPSNFCQVAVSSLRVGQYKQNTLRRTIPSGPSRHRQWMYTLWTTEVEYWKEDLRARTTRKRTSSARPDGKEKMSTFTTVAHAAASVCIAGVVILSAAWAAYKKRSRTPNTSSTNHEEHVGGDVPATRALAVYGRGMGSAPAFSRDLRLLLLRAVVEEETTPSPSTQRVIAQALEPVPAVSLSGLVNSDDSVSKELWLLVVPTPEFAASLLRLFEQQNGGVALLSEEAPASNTTLPLLLCGAGGAEGPKETGAEDMGAVLAMVQLLGSTPKIAAWLASSSPSTSSRDGDGKDLSSLSDESLLVRPTLWGATIKNPSSAATLDLEDSLSPTSSLGQTPTNLEGFVGPVLALEVEGKPVSPQSASCKGGNNDRGGGRV
ncbi:unnamed protein product, partial [Pylaiella littoralis]